MIILQISEYLIYDKSVTTDHRGKEVFSISGISGYLGGKNKLDPTSHHIQNQ